jgi:hypothetical protein
VLRRSGVAVRGERGADFPVVCASRGPEAFRPYVTSVTIPGPISGTVPNVLSLTWPPGAPPGLYTFVILATPPGALGDGVLDENDILTIGVAELTAAPSWLLSGLTAARPSCHSPKPSGGQTVDLAHPAERRTDQSAAGHKPVPGPVRRSRSSTSSASVEARLRWIRIRESNSRRSMS